MLLARLRPASLARPVAPAAPPCAAFACVRSISGSAALDAPFVATRALLQQAKKKGSAGPAVALVEEKFDLKKQIPVNLLKEGGEPEYKPDDQYPPWLFKLLDEKPMLEDYVMKGLEKVPTEEMKRVFRLANKRRIKEANDSRRKE